MQYGKIICRRNGSTGNHYTINFQSHFPRWSCSVSTLYFILPLFTAWFSKSLPASPIPRPPGSPAPPWQNTRVVKWCLITLSRACVSSPLPETETTYLNFTQGFPFSSFLGLACPGFLVWVNLLIPPNHARKQDQCLWICCFVAHWMNR